jgi:hypothetical protein
MGRSSMWNLPVRAFAIVVTSSSLSPSTLNRDESSVTLVRDGGLPPPDSVGKSGLEWRTYYVPLTEQQPPITPIGSAVAFHRIWLTPTGERESRR